MKDSQQLLFDNEYDFEWKNMPEFSSDDLMPYRQIIVSFDTAEDVKKFSEVIGQIILPKTKSIWFPKKNKNILKNLRYINEN